MNELGIIDAVMTDDGDVFLYGARVVIRKCVRTFLNVCVADSEGH